MTIKAKLNDLSIAFKEGGQKLTFLVYDDFRPFYDELSEKELMLEIKEYHKKRTLSMNAYAWLLINKLAGAVKISKDEVYKQMLRDYGQSDVISVKTGCDISRCVKYYDEIGKGSVNGKEFTHYRVYIGSSEYDTKEFSDFLDGIISECEQVGIPTATPRELALIKERLI